LLLIIRSTTVVNCNLFIVVYLFGLVGVIFRVMKILSPELMLRRRQRDPDEVIGFVRCRYVDPTVKTGHVGVTRLSLHNNNSYSQSSRIRTHVTLDSVPQCELEHWTDDIKLGFQTV
jgi:hypothetical protein